MAHVLLTRFERRVVRPFWVLHGVLALVILFKGYYLTAAILGVLWLPYGMIAQALRRDLTPQQLARGEHVTRPREGSELDELSVKDSNHLGKAVVGFTATVAITSLVITFHFGVRWFLAIPIGVACLCIVPFLSLVLAGGATAFRIWRDNRRQHAQ